MTRPATPDQILAGYEMLCGLLLTGAPMADILMLAQQGAAICERSRPSSGPAPDQIEPESGRRVTSAEAARFVSRLGMQLNGQVLRWLVAYEPLGATNSQLCTHFPERPSTSIQPRTSQLCRYGYATPSGNYRLNDRRQKEIVWRPTPRGIEWVQRYRAGVQPVDRPAGSAPKAEGAAAAATTTPST